MKKITQVMAFAAILLAFIISSAGMTEAATKEFTDVPKNHSNYEAIQAIQQGGYITGYPDGTFRPGESIKRKHVAKLLNQALKLPELTGNEAAYIDVPKSNSYYIPIMKLTTAGIFSGGLDGKFNPEAPMTRIQMAKVLDFAFDFHMTVYDAFDDVPRAHWGYVHANALYASGVAKGNKGSFYPNRPVTRGHYAEFLHRALKADAAKPNRDKLTKDKAQDLSSRLTHSIETAMMQGKAKKQTFAEVRPTLLKYATANFADSVLKRYYPFVCNNCDTFFFPFELNMEYELRFNYAELNPNVIEVNTVEFEDRLVDAAFIDYKFKKELGKWKMATFDNRPIGEKLFDLTVDEAKRVVMAGYKRYQGSDVTVTYVAKTVKTGHDNITNIPYTYDLYTFEVVEGKRKTEVKFNSASGMYE